MKKYILITVLWLLLGGSENVYGMELEDYSFDGIQEIMEENGTEFDFYNTAMELQSGDTSVFRNIVVSAKDAIVNEFAFNRKTLGRIIGLAIASAIIGGFSNVFNNNQIGSTGFGILYMLLIIVLIGGFMAVITVTEGILKMLLDFMKMLMPTYFMAVGMSGNVSSTLVFYEITMILIMVIEWMFLSVFIPMVKIYVVISIIDHMSKERVLSKMSGMIKKFLAWLMKMSVAAVAGINIIEGMVAPAADSAAMSAVSRFTSIIPGLGSSANTLSGIAIGAGNLIKNTIGGAGLIAIIVIAIVPALKVGASSAIYQVLAAVLQPVTDKRITECISVVGSSMEMLFKIILTSALLFMITIAVICISTNSTYYGMS